MEDEAATFSDYFFVCGLDISNGLQTDVVQDVDCGAPLERCFRTRIVSCYPQSRPNRPFYNECVALCMPRGVRFYTQKDKPAEPSFHTFVLIREDGTKIDGAALTFYEEVTDPILCDAMHNLHTAHVKELTAAQHGQKKTHLLEQGYHPPGQATGGSHTLPRRGNKRHKRTSYYDCGRDTLFMSRCICLVGRLPIVQAASTVLHNLYRLSSSASSPALPLESYVHWILNEVPLPLPGGTLKVTMESSDLVVQRPSINELPFFDYRLCELFELISVETFVKVFTCILLEQQVLLCSKVLSRLMLVSESLISLAFPFKWQHVYVPILPYAQALYFLEAPLPFIMGLCYDETIPEQVYNSTKCVLDIDNERLELPEDIPSFPDRSGLIQELYLILEKYSHGYSYTQHNPTVFESESPESMSTISQAETGCGTNLHTVNQCNDQYRINASSTQPQQMPQPQQWIMRRGRQAMRDEMWSNKRMSRSFDEDANSLFREMRVSDRPEGMEDNSPPSKPYLAPLQLSVLQESETMARVTAIARKAGVHVDLDHLQQELDQSDIYKNSSTVKKYFQQIKFNNAVREVFLNRFVHLFTSYDHFVIGAGSHDREDFVNNRDSMQNFDKASFLSDQPDSHLAFLAAFIETQKFTTFVDWKILSQWEKPEPNLQLFDARINQLREKFGTAIVRTPTYETSPIFSISEDLIKKREEALDFVVPAPHNLSGLDASKRSHDPGSFPLLDGSVLEQSSMMGSPNRSPWRQRNRRLKPSEIDTQTPIDEKRVAWLRHLVATSGKQTASASRPPSYSGVAAHANDLTPAQIALTNWKFVESLLRETKQKTKRLLVEKMGKEAVELGHTDMYGINGVEENTLVASFCDLLERIWAHGLRKHHGKSSLWAHLLGFQDIQRGVENSGKNLHSTPFLSPEGGHPVVNYLQTLQKDLSADSGMWSHSLLRAASFICDKIGPNYDFAPSFSNSNLACEGTIEATSVSPNAPPESPRKRSYSRPRSPDWSSAMRPLPTYIAFDLKNVLKMSEIKTDIGYARAFVRLSLERKLLHKHLKTLLANHDLLRSLYKRYAFLNQGDETEQFLYHLLSLNAADFRCFTNTFTRTKTQYQVLLVPGGGRFTMSNNAHNLWVKISGTLAETPTIKIPKNTLQFHFDHANLGVLSTMRVGHDSSDESQVQTTQPKWYLEYVIVRNEITGRTYKFPCARWFGKGVDDGSLERLLVAQALPMPDLQDTPSSSRCRSPARGRSPSARRVTDNPKIRIIEIQQQLGEAVNNIVKYFYRASEKEKRSQLTRLLCGDRGLINTIEKAFLVGLKTSRIFKQSYPWDYIEKTFQWYSELLNESGGRGHFTQEQKTLINHAIRLLNRIERKQALGKDGKFQLFILISIKDHVLSGLLPLMAWTPITGTFYDEPSFLRSPNYCTYLNQLLNSLNEFHFDLETSLTFGIFDDKK